MSYATADYTDKIRIFIRVIRGLVQLLAEVPHAYSDKNNREHE